MREIGVGGMGTVLLAEEIGMRRMVALKVLPMDRARSKTMEERCRREGEALARLEHPNIVPAAVALSTAMFAKRGMSIRVPPLAARNFQLLFKVLRGYLTGQTGDLVEVFGRCAKELGDGVFRFLAGHAYASRNQLEEAENAFRQAIGTPSVILSRRTMGFYLVTTLLLRLDKAPSDQQRRLIKREINDAIAATLDAGPLTPRQIRKFRQIAQECRLLELSVELTARDVRLDPKNAETIKAFRSIRTCIK